MSPIIAISVIWWVKFWVKVCIQVWFNLEQEKKKEDELKYGTSRFQQRLREVMEKQNEQG